VTFEEILTLIDDTLADWEAVKADLPDVEALISEGARLLAEMKK